MLHHKSSEKQIQFTVINLFSAELNCDFGNSFIMDATFIVFLLLVSVSSFRVQAQNGSFSSILTFGDSTFDPGNNNFINTLAKANFAPYGLDLQSDVQKGRFCNGKLIPDFLAAFFGLKDLVPPYLDKSLGVEELSSGVSFASAATGYDPFTPRITNAISVQKQLELFKDYKKRLEGVMGINQAKSHIENALCIVSCGANDFAINYFFFPVRRVQFNIIEFQNFVIVKARRFLQGLTEVGARKVVVIGALPIGCLPVIITLKSNNSNVLQRQCLEDLTDVARQFNQKLQGEIQAMQNNPQSVGTEMVYIDVLEPLLEIIQNFRDLGFEWNRGCCGSGLIEVAGLCNRFSPVCRNRSEIVFWDSAHPTERVYYLLSLRIRKMIISTFH